MKTRVLIVGSEAVPLIKSGGLADVITALTENLRNKKVDASILMPGYPAALENAVNLKALCDLSDLPGGAGTLLLGTLPDSDTPVILLDTPRFRNRCSRLYVNDEGTELDDNALCFAALSHAAVAICAGRTPFPVPHVVHVNDWHTGLVPALLRAQNVKNVGSVMTIHNLAFQGNYPMDIAASLGIPSELLTSDGVEFWQKISFMKAGIRYADKVTTVSQSYAGEILTPRFGNGMEGSLVNRKEDLVAIANGVDMDLWNPAKDPLIAKKFSANNIRGKSACKRKLQEIFSLPNNPFSTVLALGSRITHQKMADVVLASIPALLDAHPRTQIAVLGCGEPAYERRFLELAAQHPDRIAVHIGYDEMRAHALHAGADMLLHPSRFEPYGLTPIYAMRYGTIPICSRVGGLADTIVDSDPYATDPSANANGILFDGDTPEDLLAAIKRAFGIYSHGSAWAGLQRNAMTADFSWENPVRQYIQTYSKIVPAATAQHFRRLLVEPVKQQKKTKIFENFLDAKPGRAMSY